MPQFIVTKAQDAHVLYEKVFEAASIEQANQLADADRFNEEGWSAMQETRFYDDMKILTDETVEHTVEEPREPVYLSQSEKDAIIAALRLWQDNSMVPPALVEIACNGRVQGLTDDEIDILIEEKINV